LAAQEGGRFVAVSIVTLSDNEGEFSRPPPFHLTPEKNIRHPLYRRLHGPPGPSPGEENNF